MKILIVQLARLGDIYQTWPVLNAIKRARPDAEIHVLVRSRFADATLGNESISKVWNFDTAHFVEPFLHLSTDDQSEAADTELIQAAVSRVSRMARDLSNEAFDEIINLTFSPVSASIVELVAGPSTVVRGYSRHSDGTLRIEGDASAYFFAQVGTDRSNRMHLTHVFAQVADCDLTVDDFRAPFREESASVQPNNKSEAPIVIHIGASETQKRISPDKWRAVIREIAAHSRRPFILIGGADEEVLGNMIAEGLEARVLNYVGKTRLSELFAILSDAALLIGGDSAPIHIASLTRTPTLNLSCGHVNFWETGPLAHNSRVIYSKDTGDFIALEVAREANLMLNGGDSSGSIALAVSTDVGLERSDGSSTFEWDLIKAIYMGAEFPCVEESSSIRGLLTLRQANQVALEQFTRISKLLESRSAVETGILDRLDEVIQSVATMVPQLGPLVRWFQAEKSRIGPEDPKRVLFLTREAHLRMDDVLKLYISDEILEESMKEDDHEKDSAGTR